MTTSTLKRIRVKAIRSFEQPSEVTFPERGLVLLRGVNHDTGGASGSGKSSLLLAAAQAFGYCPFPATAMQSWLTDEPYEISVDFGAYEDGQAVDATITRGARTKLVLNGATIKGSVAVVEKKLETLLGLPPELLEALTYRGQKQRSLFLSMTDADKKDFLSKVLGLEVFEQAADAAAAKAKSIDAELKIKMAGVNQLRIVRDEAHSRLIEPAPESTSVYESALAVLTERVEEWAEIVEFNKQTVFIERTKATRAGQAAGAAFDEDEKLALAEWRQAQLEAKSPIAGDPPEGLANVKAGLEECQRRIRAMEQAYSDARKLQDQELRNLDIRRSTLRASAAMKPKIEAAIAKAKTDLASLTSHTCPTCSQTWQSEQAIEVARITINTGEAELHAIEKKLVEAGQLDADRASVVPVEPDPILPRMREMQEQLSNQLAGMRAAAVAQLEAKQGELARRAAEAAARLSNIQAKQAQAASAATQQALKMAEQAQNTLEEAQKHFSEWITQQREAEKKLAEKQALNRQLETLAQTTRESLRLAEERLKQAELDTKPLSVAFAEESDFAQLVGREGFLGAIFDEVLAEISDSANKILAAVPNTSSVSICFRTESFTVKGATKRSIIPVVTISGHEAPMKSGLSGGMETAAELAVDLAIVDVVSRRTGQVPGWLILDESFTGLGLIEKECCLEILEKFAQDRLVIVVDHDNQFKEMFSDTITVERRNDRSYITSRPSRSTMV